LFNYIEGVSLSLKCRSRKGRKVVKKELFVFKI
jgi:hypothetical protein